ncbi:hypothetical protein [Ramlibacter sp. AN1133]|uniref:hypothetical protein n=1 Tax=Ramlibacter sp. AN1133 TaxID=3133429 RepID=UPI0030C4DDB8
MKILSLRRCLAGAPAAACLLAVAPSAFAQANWPARPIRMVVGFAAGGGAT